MRTSTNTSLRLPILSETELRSLAAQQTEERLDVHPVSQKNRGISSASMWKIHGQRRGIVLRQALR